MHDEGDGLVLHQGVYFINAQIGGPLFGGKRKTYARFELYRF
jgi:hypothetical protein